MFGKKSKKPKREPVEREPLAQENVDNEVVVLSDDSASPSEESSSGSSHNPMRDRIQAHLRSGNF